MTTATTTDDATATTTDDATATTTTTDDATAATTDDATAPTTADATAPTTDDATATTTTTDDATTTTPKRVGKPADKQADKQARQPLPSLRSLIVHGAAAVRRYKGLCVSLYLVQFVMAILVTYTVTSMLATVFAQRPLFDQAVAGDVAALVFVITDELYVFMSILWLASAAVLGYAIVSWYLIGGLNAVLVHKPKARGEVVKQFGAGGARTFFAYARLLLLSLVPYIVISGTLLFGMSSAADDLSYGLTFGEVAGPLASKMAPGMLLLLLHLTALDYARIELSRTIGLASRHALWRGYKMVVTDWRPMAHVLVYIGFFVAISLLYVLATKGHAMAGWTGAVALFGVRQLLLVVRFAGKMTCAAGQVTYAGERSHGRAPRTRLPVVQ